MITKAENDKTGNYIGTIWLIKYKGKDIFVTDMALGSGGIANYFFDCSGNHLIWRNGESYCPSDYVGKNHFYVDDENDFANFFNDVKFTFLVVCPPFSLLDSFQFRLSSALDCTSFFRF